MVMPAFVGKLPSFALYARLEVALDQHHQQQLQHQT